jgi:hypothetical protein
MRCARLPDGIVAQSEASWERERTHIDSVNMGNSTTIVLRVVVKDLDEPSRERSQIPSFYICTAI